MVEGHILIRIPQQIGFLSRETRRLHFPRGVIGLSVLVALLVLSTNSDARVFQSTGSNGDILSALRSSGGQDAYKSEVTINGGKGRLTVMGFTDAFPDVLRTLRRATGIEELDVETGHHLHAIVSTGKGVVRLLAFRLAENLQTIVVAIEQSRSEFKASERPPGRNMLKAIPSYPDSTPRFYMKDAGRKIGVAVSDTKAAVDAVETHLLVNLRRKGWQPALPPTKGKKSGTSFTVYMKGLDVCCTYIGPSADGNGNVITILHKEQGVE